ncbi:MAG: adenylate/guanylate cyclase domain-containing protein [Alphaproteobacteria bacterium]|nr:adenylate/guanylate cyclase domain-containing protein [Alphaproteobacteria bacterium]
MVERQDNDEATETDFSFKAEELAAQKAALWGRVIALLAIAALTSILTPWPGPVYIYCLLALFMLLGFAAYRVALAPWRKPWHIYAFVSADFALLAFTLIYPNPLVLTELPPQVGQRFGNFVYCFVLLAGLVYLYRPGLVLWGGVSAAISWSVGVVWLLNQPGAIWRVPQDGDIASFLALLGNPYFLDLGVRVQEVSVLLITSGLLALAVGRARSIALRQADLASERTNLARYFPRKTVALLANNADALSQSREHNAAVLFTDLVSFTSWSENRPPSATISVLREIHGILTEVVFKYDGTLDKFIGDGLMATFGTPEPTDRDATHALAAAVEMADRFEAWRSTRPEGQGKGLSLAIGVHYGPIVLGDIGIERRMEFAVLGNTVNIASRLEQANRTVGSRCVVSKDLADAALVENPTEAGAVLSKLDNYGPIDLRGSSAATPVFILK